jgi:hypothetical protein
MSFTPAVVLVAVLDVAIIAALAAVMLIPFRLDRRTPAPVRRIGSTDLLAAEDAAA